MENHNLANLPIQEREKIEQQKQRLYEQWREAKLKKAASWLRKQVNVNHAWGRIAKKYSREFADAALKRSKSVGR